MLIRDQFMKNLPRRRQFCTKQNEIGTLEYWNIEIMGFCIESQRSTIPLFQHSFANPFPRVYGIILPSLISFNTRSFPLSR